MSGNFKCLFLVGKDTKFGKWHVLIININLLGGSSASCVYFNYASKYNLELYVWDVVESKA